MNLSTTLAAMGVVIFSLVLKPVGSLIIFTMLLLVLVDVIGFAHFWGLPIDAVTTVNAVVALGLSVDFNAHMGKAYLDAKGAGDARMVHALKHMGPPVFSGGASTLIAALVLSAADSYIFINFFRMLFMTVAFGLSHGLILLPVSLSLFVRGDSS